MCSWPIQVDLSRIDLFVVFLATVVVLGSQQHRHLPIIRQFRVTEGCRNERLQKIMSPWKGDFLLAYFLGKYKRDYYLDCFWGNVSLRVPLRKVAWEWNSTILKGTVQMVVFPVSCVFNTGYIFIHGWIYPAHHVSFRRSVYPRDLLLVP